MKNLKLLSLMAVMFFYGCAAREPNYIALSPEVQPQITSTDVYMVETHKNIGFDVEQPHVADVMGGGLLPALIDSMIVSSRESTAREILHDLNQEVLLIPVEQKLRTKLVPVLKSAKWLKVANINHPPHLTEDEKKAILESDIENCVMITRMTYTLNPDFSVLTGNLFLELHPTGKSLKAGMENKWPIYKTMVTSTLELENCCDDKKQNADLWLKDNGQYLRRSFDNLLNDLTQQLASFLDSPHYSLEG